LTLQGQAGKRVQWGKVLQSLLRELPLGIALGLACGGLIAVAAWAWQGRLLPAVCILASVTLSICTATVLGLLVPSVLMATQRDPKLASGPIALAATDMLTMVYYLGLATWVLL
jgi:magnesium transporter